MDPREKDLIERVLGGDTAAFEPLVTPYRTALFRLASRIVRNSEDAQEVAQESLFKAFRYLRSCDPALGFRNWLYQIVVNTARTRGRRQSESERRLAAIAFDSDGPSRAPNPEMLHERTEARVRLRECLDTLSDREREIFWLREIEDLNVDETARALGCSSISVRVHLTRARRKVRDRFKAKYPDLIGGQR